MTDIIVVEIVLRPKAFQHEVDKYGKEGLKRLWMDILERYAHEEYYDPDIIHEMLEHEQEEDEQ